MRSRKWGSKNQKIQCEEKKSIRKLNVAAKHVLKEIRLVPLWRGFLLCTSIKEKVLSGQEPTQLRF